MNTHPRGIALPVVIIVLGVVLATAIVGIVAVQKRGASPAPANIAVTANTNITANVNANVTMNANSAVNTNTTTNTNTPDDTTADWKTYTNAELGYSIMYPPSWTVRPGDPASIDSSKEYTVEYPEGYTYGLIIKTQKDPNEIGKLQDSKKLTINGTEATQGEIPGIPDVTVTIIQKGSTILRISWAQTIPEQIPRQILSTLTFTSPTADWKTYTNTKYAFSFHYPADWQVSEEESPYRLADGFFVTPPGERWVIAILPRGEYDRGVPAYSRIESATLGGKTTERRIFSNEENGAGVLCWYQFPQAPAENWLVPGNRIETPCTETEAIKTLLSTFQFTE